MLKTCPLTTVMLMLLAGCAGGAETKGPVPLELVQTIPLPDVGGRIDHMSADVKGGRLFVAALGNGSVEVIDLAAGKIARSIAGLKEPQGVLYLADLNRLVVACGGDGTVRFYDAATFAPLKSLDSKDDADNLRYDPAAKRIYFGYGSGGLGVIDPEKMEQVGDIPLKGHPESFQLESRGPRIFVNVPTQKHVAVVDRRKQTVVATWPVADARDNFPMALDEANRRLLVVCRKPSAVLIFDTESGKTTGRFDCSGDADDIFLDAATKRAYLSAGQGFVEVFEQADADHYKLLAKTPTFWMARTSLFVPVLGRYYVAAGHMVPLAHEAKLLVFAVRP